MSITKLASRGWYHAMGNATEKLHQEDFPRALVEALQRVFTFDCVLILIYPVDSIPVLVYEEDFPNILEKRGEIAYYLEGIYLLDPFYQLAMKQPDPGLYLLKEVAPDHFHRSEFFQRHFVYSHLKDEINYLLPLDNVGTVAISIGCTRRFTPAEMERFRALEPWVLSMMKCHWSKPSIRQEYSVEHMNLHQQLSAGFQNFGRSQLTDRECDIAQLILKGFSSKAAALKLHISDETVKVHRRNIYKKLNIQSQSELFSLFLSFLAAKGSPHSLEESGDQRVV